MFDEHARHGEKAEYSASNPHPLFGKDPNILNELGHTKYPMYVDHPTEKNAAGFPVRVVVNDEDHHAEVIGATAKAKPKKGDEGWSGNK